MTRQAEAASQLDRATEQRALAARALEEAEAARAVAADAAAQATEGQRAAEAEVARLRAEGEDRRARFMQLQVMDVKALLLVFSTL